MNIKLYNAAHAQLKAKAMESIALISVLLENPTMLPDHSSLVQEIVKHTRQLCEHEGALLTFQQYFGPAARQQAPPAPPTTPVPTPPPVRTTPLSEEELMKRSSTFRKSPPGKARAKAQKKKAGKEKE